MSETGTLHDWNTPPTAAGSQSHCTHSGESTLGVGISELEYRFHLWCRGWNPHFKSMLAPKSFLDSYKKPWTSITKAMNEERIPTELRWHLQVTSQRWAVGPCELVPIFCHQFLPRKGENRIAHYNNVGPSAGAWNARVSQRSCRE